MDERGKYILITQEELLNLVNFIQKEGRISKTMLTREANKLI